VNLQANRTIFAHLTVRLAFAGQMAVVNREWFKWRARMERATGKRFGR
jgi:hypothetical protein